MKLLTEIANKYGTDKGTTFLPSHGFSEIYDDYLVNNRHDILRVLEIGIDRGNSLRMWRDYFPNAMVYGLDVQKHQFFTEERISTHYANQSSFYDISNFINEFGGEFDLIIDDGGHDPIYQQITLGYLFRHLKNGGLYIVEDLHTSFMTDWLTPIERTEDSQDIAYNVLKRLEQKKELVTPHINDNDIRYIIDNLKEIKMFDIKNDKNHITSILIKK